MTTYLVTGASGHLGRLVVQRPPRPRRLRPPTSSPPPATPPRSPTWPPSASSYAGADYTDPGLARRGVRRRRPRPARLLQRRGRARRAARRNVIEAAAAAGVELLGYTSVTRADTSRMLLAEEHRATEELLADAGLPTVLLRNSWYLENYTDQLPTALEHGAVLGAAGDGRVSAATRADYAAAAAAALVADDQAGRVHELGGDVAFTLDGVRRLRWPRRPAPRSPTATCPPRSTPQCWSPPACRRGSPPSSPTPTSASPAASCTPTPGDLARLARPPDHHADRGDPRRAGVSGVGISGRWAPYPDAHARTHRRTPLDRPASPPPRSSARGHGAPRPARPASRPPRPSRRHRGATRSWPSPSTRLNPKALTKLGASRAPAPARAARTRARPRSTRAPSTS